MQHYYVYILKCNDGSFYVGRTHDVEQRVSEHSVGNGCFFTAQRLPIKLVFVEEMSSEQDAYDMEMRIKGWSRTKKEALIAGDWDKIKMLAKKKFINCPSI